MANSTITTNKWQGPAIPFSLGSQGPLSVKTTSDLIKSSIFFILTTIVGTRIMRPTFGSVFLEVLFEPNDAILKSRIETYIPQAINKWEPRLEGVKVTATPDNKNVSITLSGTIIESGDKINSYFEFRRNEENSLRLVG